MSDSVIRSRIDPIIKEEATQVLSSMGLTISDAIRIFLYRVVSERAIPFSLKMPNPTTLSAMRSSDKGDVETVTIDDISKEWDDAECEK